MDAVPNTLNDCATSARLSSLSRRSRLLLAGLLVSGGVCYCAVLVVAYLQVTSARSLWPDLKAVDSVFFGRAKAIGAIERLLESSDGPMNRAGTMRPAFTDQSVGWESLTQNITAEEKSELATQRDGERLALLAWIRSGLSRAAFEGDDFRWEDEDADHPITSAYLAVDQPLESDRTTNVRIRSIVNDRCVTCHGENGRHELARWIPLDTYESIERHSRPETDAVTGAKWLIAALGGLLPLGLVSGPLFYTTATPAGARRFLAVVPLVALAVAGGCWLFGNPGSSAIYLLIGTAGIAAIGVLFQIIASVAELLGHQERP